MVATFLLTLLTLWVLAHLSNRRAKGRPAPKSLMLVFGSGGHTTELLLMLENLNVAGFAHVHILVAQTDTWSMTKIKTHCLKNFKHPFDIENTPNVTVWRVKRAREVKQSYVTSVLTTLIALAHSALIVARTRVDLIVTNGPGTAVPLVLANWALAKVMGWKSQALFIESFCRVKSLSLSGKILRRFVDK